MIDRHLASRRATARRALCRAAGLVLAAHLSLVQAQEPTGTLREHTACIRDTSLFRFLPNPWVSGIVKPAGPLCPSAVDFTARVRVTMLPTYPVALRNAGVSGEVLAVFVFGADGRVDPSSLELVRSTHQQFTDAVREAIAQWKGEPALLDGDAYGQWVAVYFQFKRSCADARNPPVVGNSACLCIAPPEKR
jgi:TonB family protein